MEDPLTEFWILENAIGLDVQVPNLWITVNILHSEEAMSILFVHLAVSDSSGLNIG